MSKICFVSYEISPTTWGGAGVLISESVKVLTEQGHHVVLVLDVQRSEFEQFLHRDRYQYPNPELISVHQVGDLCADLPYSQKDFQCEFDWVAFRFHWATKKIVELEKPDMVEFFDYIGIAYHALSAKLCSMSYESTNIAIRLHNSIEAMDANEPTRLDYSRYILYALEHQALRLAEIVLFPSKRYFNKAYKPFYEESWLGESIHSPPALTISTKRKDIHPDAKSIIFFGRLFGFKGIDRFVDAAIQLLFSEDCGKDISFVLLGYDSKKAPDGSATYQEYLRKRIPGIFQNRFKFPGHLDKQALDGLLPDVLFAVFPNYFESFGYAVHELYTAGVPLILNDIPAFQDYFKDRENALFFDGTTGDLARKMQLLLRNPELRDRLRIHNPVLDTPLGQFYTSQPTTSWMRKAGTAKVTPSLLVLILDKIQDPQAVARTLNSLPDWIDDVYVLSGSTSDTLNYKVQFLGSLYDIRKIKTTSDPGKIIQTQDAILILEAGDVLNSNYVPTALQILAMQPELSFVGCWKEIRSSTSNMLDTFPFDAALEALPFRKAGRLSRAVKRTAPGTSLVDLFESRLGELGEIGYLWQIDENMGPGTVMPYPLISIGEVQEYHQNPRLLSFLLHQATSSRRRKNIARYLFSICWGTNLGPDHDTAARLQRVESELAEIHGSRGWKVLSLYRKLKVWLLTKLPIFIRRKD
jgi:glycosyltransferase involved in cell wall biosynthesis